MMFNKIHVANNAMPQAPIESSDIEYEALYSKTGPIVNSRSASFTLDEVPPADILLVLWIGLAEVASISSIPAEWVNPLGGTTIVVSDTNSGVVLIHKVTAAEALAETDTWTLTNLFSDFVNGNVLIDAFSNVNTVTPVNATSTIFSSDNAATPHKLPGITPTVDNGLVCGAVLVNSLIGGGYSAGPTGWTVRHPIDGTSAICTTSWTYDLFTVDGTPIAETPLTPIIGDEYCAIAVVLAPNS